MWTMTGGVAAAAMLLAMPSPTLQSEFVRKEKFIEPVVTVAGAAQDGYTTYALWLRALPGADVGTIYTIYGDSHVQMTMPPAFQDDAPFGCDIGGVNPAFYTY